MLETKIIISEISNMISGCLTIFFQSIHVTFSLGGLLLLMSDLGGSIVINEAGKVENYQDFGGGISSLFSSMFIALLLFVMCRIINRNYGPKAAIIGYFAFLLSTKTAIIWNIYFSGRTDARILAAYPLNASHIIPDIIAIIAAIVLLKILKAKQS